MLERALVYMAAVVAPPVEYFKGCIDKYRTMQLETVLEVSRQADAFVTVSRTFFPSPSSLNDCNCGHEVAC
jgi:sigma54-dependent transcription regulator